MSRYTFNAGALRITKARTARLIPGTLKTLLGAVAGLSLISGVVLIILGHNPGLSLTGVAVALITTLIWIRRDLDQLPAAAVGSTTQLEALLPLELASHYREPFTAAGLWQALGAGWETRFICVRFGLDLNLIAQILAQSSLDPDQLWSTAEQTSTELGLPTLEAGTILTALFAVSPELTGYLTKIKLTPADLAEGARWVHRVDELSHIKRPIYGGIARDWASGFTPQLSRFGTNISLEVESAAGNLATQERTDQLDDLVTGLNSASGSVVLIGEPGVGKSALLLGLAERLLQGRASRSLAHYQIYSLSASTILSSSERSGDIERIVMTLLSEAGHAGNIIIALDEAQLFFGQGTGAVNLSQVLLPLLQSRSFKLVLALTPGDWQRLKATNTAMASLLTPLVLAEPGQANVVRQLADRALYLEKGQLLTTYSALVEAYRLSGRYLQDEAYPGKALKLLEAAFNHPDGSFISEISVEQAIESQFGVKVQTATSAESDVLLHLEDKIHERMINQTRAVSVVANALRRARAGVANPKRPIGSFLFLGPTGVGKTELARSIAALYFGNESNIIRLDMSEYQQIADVDRILMSAAENPSGLLPRVRQTPFSVVLFDEIEKAHPNILNLLLQLLDEGNLTDTTSHPASFKDAIIIATSNAGAEEIRQRIEAGQALETFEQEFTNSLIDSGAFRPELLNRFDEIVLFRPLNQAELAQVVRLMITEVNKTLANQKIIVALTDAAAAELVVAGYDPRLGARPMRRMVTRRVEDTVAAMILRGEARPGDTITLDAGQLGGGSEPTPVDPPLEV
ncbi:MAG TPA: AAA family ATPase [Candidatus Saccharimonadia bacterium]|nr:AAA family ATPase [Candidatus Saccharimonadia bacterium]